MVPMHGVPSSLIARNESWVRRQAQAMVRHLPASVEKADLIQVGLIAVAQAAIGFRWEGEPGSPGEDEAFVRYAHKRVKGAMLDELRQMDVLTRAQRRQIKALQVARERWTTAHGSPPALAELAAATGLDLDEVAGLLHLEETSRTQSLEGGDDEDPGAAEQRHPATPRDEVEARVDTAIVLRRLHEFFAHLPERERRVIESQLGVGVAPSALAASLDLSPARISQIYKALVERFARRLGMQAGARATDRAKPADRAAFDAQVERREAELREASGRPEGGPWGELLERVFGGPLEGHAEHDGFIVVEPGTRWG
jgi:RNA polymerase sigma factor for flagellar operon FliA